MAQWTHFINYNFIFLIYFPPSGCFSSGHPEASLTRFCVKLLICAWHCFLHEHISPTVIFGVRQCGWLTAEHLQKSGQGKLILMPMNHDVKNSKFVWDYRLLLQVFLLPFELISNFTFGSHNPNQIEIPIYIFVVCLTQVWGFVWWRLCRTALRCEVRVWQVDPKGKNILSQVICPWEHEKILHFKSQKSFFSPLLIRTQHQWAFSSSNQIWGNLPPSLKVMKNM